MNNLRNQVQLIGHLGQEVNVKELADGKKLATASIATKDIYENNKGQKIIETQWHKIVGWGKNAITMENLLRKGKEVAVRGKLVHRKYTDQEGNIKQYTEVVIREMLLVS